MSDLTTYTPEFREFVAALNERREEHGDRPVSLKSNRLDRFDTHSIVHEAHRQIANNGNKAVEANTPLLNIIRETKEHMRLF